MSETLTAPAETPSLDDFRAGKPGIYPGIPFRDYLALDAVSSTLLKAMRRSPAHALAKRDEPQWSDALMLGDATHLLTLQGYDTLLKTYGEAQRCTAETSKKQQCSREASVFIDGDYLCTQHADGQASMIDLLSIADWNAVHEMSDAILTHPAASFLLDDDGAVELSILWLDADTGLLCKCRLDKYGAGMKAITDLKTTTDASPDKFSRAIYDYGYEIQGAHYLNGAAAVGLDATTFGIIAAEKEVPWCVAVYELEPEAIGLGYDQAKRLMKRYAECRRTGVFPGYPTDINRIGVPVWAERKINERGLAS